MENNKTPTKLLTDASHHSQTDHINFNDTQTDEDNINRKDELTGFDE